MLQGDQGEWAQLGPQSPPHLRVERGFRVAVRRPRQNELGTGVEPLPNVNIKSIKLRHFSFQIVFWYSEERERAALASSLILFSFEFYPSQNYKRHFTELDCGIQSTQTRINT